MTWSPGASVERLFWTPSAIITRAQPGKQPPFSTATEWSASKNIRNTWMSRRFVNILTYWRYSELFFCRGVPLSVYLLSLSSGCDTWTRSGPSRSRLPPPAEPADRTCLCPCRQWWCPQPGPRSAASQRGDDRLRPKPRLLASVRLATGSSRR